MRVAVFQFAPVVGDVEANLAAILAASVAARRRGARLLVTPEMGLTGWSLERSENRDSLAAAVERRCLPALSEAARSSGMGIVVGGPIGPGAPSNAAVLLADDGSRIDYRKIHLFGAERGWWVPGFGPAVGRVAGVRVGLNICYDAEFPEVPRLTRLAGADLLAVPTTNMHPYERDQDVIFAARAIENECPVIVANRIGSERGWRYFGRSLVLDARGAVVAQAGDGQELLVGDVELASVADPDLSYLAHRRPDVYRPLADRPATDPSIVMSSRAVPISGTTASGGDRDA
jgi:predicted amidohydrolase